MKEKFMTSIGGQALIEGVMMRGPEKIALAVRKPDGEIYTEVWDAPKPKWYSKVPFVRGGLSLVSSMVLGYKCLMKSAEIAGMDEESSEPTKFEMWLSEKLHINIMTIVAAIAVIFATALSMLLFIVLPTAVAGIVTRFTGSIFVRSIVEGILKILVFIGYLVLVAKMPDIRRVFQYHGGEHKTIACYEAKEELTVENARKMSRFHPRCGTSFILITVVLSILIFTMVSVQSTVLRIALKLILMPLVVGISYEIIRFAGRHNNIFTRAISKPGLWLQRITTNEPDDSQLEVAIASMLPVIPNSEGADAW